MASDLRARLRAIGGAAKPEKPGGLVVQRRFAAPG